MHAILLICNLIVVGPEALHKYMPNTAPSSCGTRRVRPTQRLLLYEVEAVPVRELLGRLR